MTRVQAGRTVRRAVPPLLLAAGLSGLSGCGVAGTDFHPGVAARVGDQTISVSKVDSVATSYCGAIEGQLAGQGQVLPLRYLRGGVVGQLALVEGARQFADQHGVEAGKQYDQKVAQLQSAVANLPDDQQDAVIEIESSATYISGVEQAVGEQLLAAQSGTKPQPAAATAAGQKAFAAWLDDQDVDFDPQFSVKVVNAQAVPTDTSVSFALGDAATSGDARSPDSSYASGLPDSQRCG